MMISNVGTKVYFFEEKRPLNTAKVIAQIWGALVGMWVGMPVLIQDSMIAVVVLWTLDTGSGYVLAGMEGRIRSRTLAQGAVKKALQYGLLIGTFGVFAMIAHSPLVAMPAFGVVIMTEASSIIENVYRMEQGGAKMPGGLREMVRRLGKYLAVSAEEPPATPATPVTKEEVKPDAN